MRSAQGERPFCPLNSAADTSHDRLNRRSPRGVRGRGNLQGAAIVAHGRSGMAKRGLRLITISWKRGFCRYAHRLRRQSYRESCAARSMPVPMKTSSCRRSPNGARRFAWIRATASLSAGQSFCGVAAHQRPRGRMSVRPPAEQDRVIDAVRNAVTRARAGLAGPADRRQWPRARDAAGAAQDRRVSTLQFGEAAPGRASIKRGTSL